MLTEHDTTKKKRGLRIVAEHLSSVIKEVFFSVRFMDDQFQIDYLFLLFPLFNFL